jgi:acetylglutamate kinase
MRTTIFIIKIGGNIIDDETKLSVFLENFSSIGKNDNSKKILIHGGGKLATKMADQLGIQQQMVNGRRVTDAETLKIATMVYAGLINKSITAQLQALNTNAIGLTGADGNMILSHKRKADSTHTEGGKIDFGFVGDIDEVNFSFLENLLESGYSPVIAPITHDGKGQLLNTNADSIAQEIAKALSPSYDVTLIYAFEKTGVLLDANDDNSVIAEINPSTYRQLKAEEKIFAGMIPKLDNAFHALNNGVKKVIIGKAENLSDLINGTTGTSIINE